MTKLFGSTAVAVATVSLFGSSLDAATRWGSGRNLHDPAHQGSYSELRNTTTRDADGGGYGNHSADGRPVRGYGDFFNDSDFAVFNNIAINPAAGQRLTLEARAGNDTVHQFQVQFFAVGSSTPLGTFDATRFRATGWQGSSWTYAPLQGFDLPAGSYDVRVTSVSGGSHFAGIGLWSPRHTAPTSAGATSRIEAEHVSWSNYDVNAGAPTLDGGNSGTGWIDNQWGNPANDWADFEISGLIPGATYDLRVRHRGDGGQTTFDFRGVEADGDLTAPLTSLTVDDTNGWQGSPWVESPFSTTFVMPEGVEALRLTKSGGAYHLDAIDLRLVAVPEPTAVALVATGAVALLARRRRGC